MNNLPFVLFQQQQIDRLPPELLTKILNHLDVNDILRCRLVSKRWKSVIESNVRIKNLVIAKSINSFSKNYIEFTFERIETGHYFFTNNLNIFMSTFKSIFNGLKVLVIDLEEYEIDNSLFTTLNLINQFTYLEHLEIRYLNIEKGGILSLPNLKRLSIDCFSYHSKRIKFNMPKLESVKLDSFSKSEFYYPQSILNIIAETYEPKFKQFVNLESVDLECFDNDFHDQINADPLNILSKLKRLNCSRSLRKEVISNILQIKAKRRFELKVYYFNLEIGCRNDLEFFDEIGDYLIEINKIKYFNMIMNNYFKLDQHVNYLTKINYNTLISFYESYRINDLEFCGKFMNVRKLVVTNWVDEQQLICFMKNYMLVKLKLVDCKFNQQFYDRLSIDQNKIEHLKIKSNDKQQKLDFNFVMKFDHLETFKTNLKSPCSLVSTIFDSSDSIDYFKFRFDDLIKIKVYGYSIKISSDKSIDFEKRKDTIIFLKRLDIFQSL